MAKGKAQLPALEAGPVPLVQIRYPQTPTTPGVFMGYSICLCCCCRASPASDTCSHPSCDLLLDLVQELCQETAGGHHRLCECLTAQQQYRDAVNLLEDKQLQQQVAPAVGALGTWRLLNSGWRCYPAVQRTGKKALILDPRISGALLQLDAGLSELFSEHGISK